MGRGDHLSLGPSGDEGLEASHSLVCVLSEESGEGDIGLQKL